MLVYLTSVAAKTLDKLITLLHLSPRDMKAVFITTAGDLYNDTTWIAKDGKNLLSLWFTVE